VLGVHRHRPAAADISAAPLAAVLRVLFPEAEQVHAVAEAEPQRVRALAAVATPGLFETALGDAEGWERYRLSVRDRSGRTFVTRDSYAFRSWRFTDLDQHLFSAGNHYRIFEKLGGHPRGIDGIDGVNFCVWAPNAAGVSVVGAFNNWDGRRHQMHRHGASGVWETFIPDIGVGELYKFEMRSAAGTVFLKADPYALATETPPATASIVYPLQDRHVWRDDAWMEQRRGGNPWQQPMAIYEVHLGSWLRHPGGESLSYRELADRLIPYVKDLGFTHIELLPITEHPYEPSWGYQVTNYYAPTSRYGRPEELMAFIDACHCQGIGVILDWVPAHFPKDAFALAWYDGTHLYEHADPRQGEHRDWGTLIFNYGRHEVENFLIANALFWLEFYHFDGLRVDAVASMLYLDYSKPRPGDWIPNKYGGRENIDAIEFLKHTNAIVHERFPGVLMIAEESTAWPKVSRPAHLGGLGFGFKWNMGWMHDVLGYFACPPEYRCQHHNKLTFGLLYAFDENFILSLSHDEVVHMKRSLLNKMPGDDWEKFANLRLLFLLMYTHPGKKLFFMGGEFGQRSEWNHARSLEWELLEHRPHRQLKQFVAALNHFYVAEPALFEVDFRHAGFKWLEVDNGEESILAFVRRERDPRQGLVVILNFSAISRPAHRLGVPYPVAYEVLFDSNAELFGGAAGGHGLAGRRLLAEPVEAHGQAFSIVLPVAALSGLVLRPDPPRPRPAPAPIAA
jgi:1,4-alpha-glucan branching enzyme